MTPNDLNIIKWYSSLEEQNRFGLQAYDGDFQLIASIYQFPPFDFWFDPTGGSITYLSLVRIDDGTIHDILPALVSTGLSDNQESNQGDPFDAYRYPSSAKAPLGIAPGDYYAVMRDNAGGEWFSEVISFCADTTDMVTLQWWHTEKFPYEGKFLKYDIPYKSRCVFPTNIGKPLYKFQKQSERRNGKVFTRQSVSYKEHRFWFAAPEFMLDALRTADQHDCKEIIYKGRTYRVDEIQWNVEWISTGNVAWVECVFTTDTVAVINGRALDGKSTEAEEGTCLNVSYTALGVISHTSTEYTTKTWEGSPMNDGDIFVIVGMSVTDLTVQAYSGGSFSLLPIASMGVVYAEREKKYYFHDTVLKEPVIEEILSSPDRVRGKVFDGVTVEVWVRDVNNVEYLDTIGSAADFNGGGIEFNAGMNTHVQIRVNSTFCNQFSESNWESIAGGGIGAMIIEGTNPPFEVT